MFIVYWYFSGTAFLHKIMSYTLFKVYRHDTSSAATQPSHKPTACKDYITLTILIVSFQLISLKAELSRKQEEVVKAKAQAQAQSIHPVPLPKKKTLSTKTNAGVCERAAKDLEETKEEEDAFKKSRCVCVYKNGAPCLTMMYCCMVSSLEPDSLVFRLFVQKRNHENTRDVNV
jgi:hypothetical protein